MAPTPAADAPDAAKPPVLKRPPPTFASLARHPTAASILAAREADLLQLLPALLLAAAPAKQHDALTTKASARAGDDLLPALLQRLRQSRLLKLRFLLLRHHPAFAFAAAVPLTYTSRAYDARACELRTAAASSARLQLPDKEYSSCSVDDPELLPRIRKLRVDMVDLQSDDFFAQAAFARPASSRWARRALAGLHADDLVGDDDDVADFSSTPPLSAQSSAPSSASSLPAPASLPALPSAPLSDAKPLPDAKPAPPAPALALPAAGTTTPAPARPGFARSASSASARGVARSAGSSPFSSFSSSTGRTAARIMRALRMDDAATASSGSSGRDKDRDKDREEEDAVMAPRLMAHPFGPADNAGATELAHGALLRQIPVPAADARGPMPPKSPCPIAQAKAKAASAKSLSTSPVSSPSPSLSSSPSPLAAPTCPSGTAVSAALGPTDEPAAAVTLLRLPADGVALGHSAPLGVRVHALPYDGLPHAAAAVALRLLSVAWATAWAEPFAAPFARARDAVPVGATRVLLAAPGDPCARALHDAFAGWTFGSSGLGFGGSGSGGNGGGGPDVPEWMTRGAELDSFSRSAAGALVAGYVLGLRPAAGLVLDGHVAVWARVGGVADATNRAGVPSGLRRALKALGVWHAFADSCVRAFRCARERGVQAAAVVDPLVARAGGRPGALAEFVAGRHGIDAAQRDPKKAEAMFRRWLGA